MKSYELTTWEYVFKNKFIFLHLFKDSDAHFNQYTLID